MLYDIILTHIKHLKNYYSQVSSAHAHKEQIKITHSLGVGKIGKIAHIHRE